MKLNYPLRFMVTLFALVGAAWAWMGDGVERGLDLKGGASLTYQLDKRELDVLRAKGMVTDPLLSTVAVIEDRINNMGLKDVKVDALGNNQFEVQFPGKQASEVDKIKQVLTKLGRLEFRMVASEDVTRRERERRTQALSAGRPYKVESGYRWVPSRPRKDKDGREIPTDASDETLVEIPEAKQAAELERIAAEKNALSAEKQDLLDKLNAASGSERGDLEKELERLNKGLAEADELFKEAEDALAEVRSRECFTGKDLDSGALGIHPDRDTRPGWVVSFQMRDARKKAFENFTERNLKRQMGILIDGKLESSPTIQSVLSGESQISGGGVGGFQKEEAQDLVTILQSGSLSVGIVLTQEWSIGPSLGEEAIRRGILATAIGLATVVAFMLATYLFPGLVAIFALLMNLVVIMGFLAFFRAQLSLPGIAGLILTVGMAVDANILVFERIREELKLGKTLLQSVKAGYDRAFITIVDANVTTLFSAIVLYVLTTGQVRGFAAVLVIGILSSMFTALFVTRTIFGWLIEKGVVTELKMPHLMAEPKLSYMKVRLPLIIISLVLMAGAAFAFIEAGEAKYDIEFVGGQRVVVALKKPLPIDKVKERILKRYSSATVVSIKSDTAEAQALDQSVVNDRYQITIEAAKGAGEQQAVLDFLAEEFAVELMPSPIIVSPLPESGGTAEREITINFTDPVKEEDAKTLLEATADLTSPEIVRIEGDSVVARGVLETGEELFHDNLQSALTSLKEGKVLSGMNLSEPFPMKNFVDPQTAQRHRDDAMEAVLISLIFQIIYIYFRFHGASYGFAAVLALVHDVLITLGAIALFGSLGLVNVKINLPIIAAILTLIGYSMNDSIVVFDRIRENLRKGKQNMTEVIDLSVNQTMSRTLRTSITTFLVVLVLFIVNKGAASSVLEGFAFVLMVGIITGTYSSIFVASPMLVFLPWHFLRNRGNKFWVLIAITFVGLICYLFAGSEGAPEYLQTAKWLLAAYPAFFLFELVKWLLIRDPDRALNIALRSQAGRP